MRRWLASGLALAALLALTLPVVALALRPLATDDTWWHLAMGRLYAGGNLWPAQDPLLHTAVSRQPVPHEWLFQVGLHGMHTVVGFKGLRLLHGGLVAGILAAVFASFRRASGNIAFAACATAVFASLSWFRLAQLRPDLLSIAAALSLYALVLAPEKPDLRRLAASGLLLWVWANSHSLVRDRSGAAARGGRRGALRGAARALRGRARDGSRLLETSGATRAAAGRGKRPHAGESARRRAAPHVPDGGVGRLDLEDPG